MTSPSECERLFLAALDDGSEGGWGRVHAAFGEHAAYTGHSVEQRLSAARIEGYAAAMLDQLRGAP